MKSPTEHKSKWCGMGVWRRLTIKQTACQVVTDVRKQNRKGGPVVLLWLGWRRRRTPLNRVIRENLIEKVTLKQTPEGSEESKPDTEECGGRREIVPRSL